MGRRWQPDNSRLRNDSFLVPPTGVGGLSGYHRGMSDSPTAATVPLAAAAVSGHLDTRTAATEIAHDLHDHIGSSCDLLIVFVSFHHIAAFPQAAEIIRSTLGPRIMLGVTAEAVAGVDQELEGLAGISALALQLPGVRLHPWRFAPETDAAVIRDAQAMREMAGIDDDLGTVIMLADPFTTPTTKFLPALTGCRGPGKAVRVVGGMASGASQPGINRLIYNDQSPGNGAVGVTISGPLDIDIIVSQGCRPIGEPLIVTKCKDNNLLELGGRRATDVAQELAAQLDPHERELLNKGLLAGLVINEYKDRFGRGDFLVRNILGYNKDLGSLAVGDMPRVGQTMQFHVRDAETAAEDLQLLLDGQQFEDLPFGSLLFTCNGRGERLFERPNHDVGVIQSRLGEVPLAGFFAAGEIGPIGDRSFLHGHTAALALFRGRG